MEEGSLEWEFRARGMEEGPCYLHGSLSLALLISPLASFLDGLRRDGKGRVGWDYKALSC